MIILPRDQLGTICSHSEREYPFECCGLLVGDVRGRVKRVIGSKPVRNLCLGEARRTRFKISPLDYLETEFEARGRNLDVIGFYHSHPNRASYPSDLDRECIWPSYSAVIVSVVDGRAERVESWEVALNSADLVREILKGEW